MGAVYGRVHAPRAHTSPTNSWGALRSPHYAFRNGVRVVALGRGILYIDPHACQDDMSGMINFQLSLRDGTGMTRFRKLLQREVATTLKISHTPPSREAVAYTRHIIRLCMSRGSRLVDKIVSMRLLPNGDWRDPTCVEVCLPDGVVVDRAVLAEVVADGICIALLGSSMDPINRSRFTHLDVKMDKWLRLEACHLLCTRIYPSWCLTASASARCTSFFSTGGASASSDHLMLANAGGSLALGGDSSGAAPSFGHAAVPGGEAGAICDASISKTFATVEDNTRFRGAALSWLASKPLARCLALRQVVEVWRDIIAEKMFVGGRKFEQLQRVREAKALKGVDGIPPRDFPITVAAKNLVENKALSRLAMLMFQGGMWEGIMQPESHTKKMVCFSFRLISRSICQIENDLKVRHDRFPVNMFLLLHDPSQLDRILKVRRCLWDDWSLRHESECESVGGLGGTVAYQKMLIAARLASLDTGPIESLHAAIRRRIMALGVQTHGVLFDEVSADFTIDRSRTRHHQWRNVLEVGGKSNKIVEAAGDGDLEVDPGLSESRTRAYSEWNSFVRDKCILSGKADFKALGESYRQRSPGESLIHQAMAKAANDAKGVATTRNGFGPNGDEISRMKVRASREAHIKAVLADRHTETESCDVLASSEGPNAAGAASRALARAPHGASFAEKLACARREFGIERELSRRSEEQSLKQLSDWMDSDGKESVAEVVKQIPSLLGCHVNASAVPDRSGIVLEVCCDLPKTCAHAAWLGSNARNSNLGACLGSDWAGKCAPIMHDQSEALIGDAKKKNLCRQFNFCSCSGDGVDVHKMRNSYYSRLKAACPLGTPNRDLLKSGMIVARLHGSKVPLDVRNSDPGAFSDMMIAHYTENNAFPDIEKLWHHGDHCFSPFKMTVLEMERDLERVAQLPTEMDIVVTHSLSFGPRVIKSISFSVGYFMKSPLHICIIPFPIFHIPHSHIPHSHIYHISFPISLILCPICHTPYILPHYPLTLPIIHCPLLLIP